MIRIGNVLNRCTIFCNNTALQQKSIKKGLTENEMILQNFCGTLNLYFEFANNFRVIISYINPIDNMTKVRNNKNSILKYYNDFFYVFGNIVKLKNEYEI